MKESDKRRVQYWIRQGKIERALEFLLQLPWPPEDRQEVVALAARYQNLAHESDTNLLTAAEKNTQENEIIIALTTLVQRASSNSSDPFPIPAPEPSKTQHQKTESNPPPPSKGETPNFPYISLLGSLASIIALLLYLHAQQPPPIPKGSLPLTVFVQNERGEVALQKSAELSVYFGSDHRDALIGADGYAHFGKIPVRYLDSLITIDFKVKGYELADGKNRFVFRGETIPLTVRRDQKLGLIKGVVSDISGQQFLAGAAIKIGKDTVIWTDVQGRFSISLPEKMYIPDRSFTYQLKVTKAGYKPKVSTYYPDSGAIQIRLKREASTTQNR